MESSPSTFFVRPQFGQLRAGGITSSRVSQELFPTLSSTCAEYLHVKDTVNRECVEDTKFHGFICPKWLGLDTSGLVEKCGMVEKQLLLEPLLPQGQRC